MIKPKYKPEQYIYFTVDDKMQFGFGKIEGGRFHEGDGWYYNVSGFLQDQKLYSVHEERVVPPSEFNVRRVA